MINGLTPTEHRILKLLSDGMPHHRKEVKDTCLDDELATYPNLNKHICKMRPKIASRNLEIVCVFRYRQLCYRLVQPLTADGVLA